MFLRTDSKSVFLWVCSHTLEQLSKIKSKLMERAVVCINSAELLFLGDRSWNVAASEMRVDVLINNKWQLLANDSS